MALVITIIVLLILAGISIAMLTGDNGIIKKATEAKEKTEKADIIEKAKLDIMDKQIENLGELTQENLQEILNKYFSDVPSELPEDIEELKALELTTIEGEYKITVGEIWTGSFSGTSGGLATLPSDTGTTPYLPSEEFKQVAGTDLSTGLVIEDNLGNQYVWIEIPRTEEVYPTAGVNISSASDEKFTTDEYTVIEKDLQLYTSNYKDDETYKDEYFSDEHVGLTEIEYNNLKQTMLQSVYQNGGFWIGRYEAGISTYLTSPIQVDDNSDIPTSKADEYPYTYVSCSDAQILASRVNSGNYTSSLMFGLQWDLVLRYLESKGTTQSELNSDSTSWGNYKNSIYNITNTLAKYSQDDGDSWSNAPYNKESSGHVLLTTGASSTFSKQNIYDLAGNVAELTLEYSTYMECETAKPCVKRGGDFTSYIDDGRTFASSRGPEYTFAMYNSSYDVRFSCNLVLD